MNILVVTAVFITALAIQRIVPTTPVATPKVEALPPPVAATTPPTAPSEAPATASPAAPASPAPATPTAAPKAVRKSAATAVSRSFKRADHSTPLNAGGAEDLDSEAARKSYLEKSKLSATRAPAPLNK
jgi:hypothetical protein